MIAAYLLGLSGIYLACGIIFALPFVLIGVGRIDAHAANGSWGFRVLIFPGAILLWPFLMRRWLAGAGAPPEERNAHRCATSSSCSNPRQGRARSPSGPGDRIQNRGITHFLIGGGPLGERALPAKAVEQRIRKETQTPGAPAPA